MQNIFKPFIPLKTSKDGSILKSKLVDTVNNVKMYSIIYQSRGHKVAGYLAEPKGKEKLPCIIFNRGGYKDSGALSPAYFNLFSIMANWGYLVIASQYSGGPGSEGRDDWGGEETLTDVLNLHTVLKQHPRADVKRIGMNTGSRGAIATLKALTKVSWIRAIVSSSGTYELSDTFRPEMEGVYQEAFGNTKNGKAERSALRWVDKMTKKTPILLVHGTADWRTDPLTALAIAKEFYNHKIPYRFIMFEGASHGILEFRKELGTSIHDWFDRYVKNKEPLPNLKPHGE